MRKSLALTALALTLGSCGRQDREQGSVFNGTSADAAPPAQQRSPAPPPPPPVTSSSESLQTFDAAEEPPSGGPNVSPTAAPGVAFNYAYAFRLEAQRIAAVQERHAAMCEQLGPDRCRITGMLYRVRNETDIEARLSFKLEPSIARQFGREAASVVTQAEGMLVESQISGTDVAPTIRQAGRSIAQMEEELRRVEARLRGRLSGGDRSSLEYEAQQLRQSIRAAQQNREDAQESLANTPMTFVYGSGDLVPGFDTRRPVRDAVEQAGENLIAGVAILFVLLITLLPWAALGLLVWFVVRLVQRRRRRTAPQREAGEPVAVES